MWTVAQTISTQQVVLLFEMFSNKSGQYNSETSDANFRSYLQILTYVTAEQHALTFHTLNKVIYLTTVTIVQII